MRSCPLCSHRAPSRACPALKTDICSPCCGTKRRREVSCPEECGYLHKGREALEGRAQEFTDLREVRAMDPEFMNAVEIAILAVRGTRFRDLKDSEVREAAQNLFKTAETGEKGLIYEYRSPDPRIQILIDALNKVIQPYLEGKGVSHKVSTMELKAVLMAILNATKVSIRSDPDSTAYLDLITLYVRSPMEERRPSGIIQLP